MGASKYMAMMAAHTGGGERPAPLRVPAHRLCELQQRVYSHRSGSSSYLSGAFAAPAPPSLRRVSGAGTWQSQLLKVIAAYGLIQGESPPAPANHRHHRAGSLTCSPAHLLTCSPAHLLNRRGQG